MSIRTRFACAARAAACALALGGFATLPASAHHGWNWAEPENSELSGVIRTARLGNPHGRLTLDVGGEEWVAEVGQPWRNQRAGLKDELMREGVRVTISGHRSARPGEKVIKAERVTIDGRTYNLYPDRD